MNIPLHKDIVLPTGRTIQAIRFIDATYTTDNLFDGSLLNGSPMLVEIQWYGGYGWEISTIPFTILNDLIEYGQRRIEARKREESRRESMNPI